MQFELTKDFLAELRSALSEANEVRVLELIGDLYAADIAEIIDDIPSHESKVLLQYIDAAKASDAITNLDDEDLKKLLEQYSAEEIAETFIENLDSDDAADVIQELPEEKQEEVISQIEDFDQAGDIVDLLNYEEGTAGALMGKELISISAELTVKQSVVELRRQADEVDHVYTIYVVDKETRLLGRLSLKKLLVADSRKKINNLYEPDIRSVKASADQEEVARIMEKYDLVALPVVDELGRLIGRITIDDVVDIIKEEADKDYQMASGISEDIESTDSIWLLTRGRLPWLVLGLLGGIMGARVIGVYEADLKLYPEMAFFIPLVAAMAGNVGVQSSAIVVKGLANNTLGLGGIAQKLGKEFSVALINASVCALIVLGYNLLSGSSLMLSYTVSLALVTVIVFAALFGTFVPLVLDKYKIDPALATGPFITTMNDIIGLFVYFAIGRAFYGM